MRPAVVVAVLWMAGAILLSAQDPTAPAAQQPQIFRAGVDLIRIDVNVLDKDRRPIRGLTLDDFEVFEDGKAQRVVAVSEIDSVTDDPEPSPWMRTATRDVGTNDLSDLAGSGRVFVILLDDFNTPWDDQELIMSAREIARHVVDSMLPSDLAAVVYPRDAGKTQDFTTDRRKLLDAIAKFTPREPDYFMPRGNTYRGPGPGGGDMPQRFAPSMARSNCERTQPTIPAFDTVVRRLATVPNRRKNVVFISTGVPLNLGANRDCPGQLASTMRDVFREAQRANVNIHSFDPGGYRGYEDYLQRPVRSDGRPSEYIHSAESARQAAKFRHEFMEITADHTGAHAVVNSQEIAEGVTRMFAEDASYYLIGYETSNGKPDGKFRRIEVKVKRPDTTIRARSGYYAPREGSMETNEDRRAPGSNELGLTGLTSAAGLPLRANATAIGLTADGKADVAIVLTTRLPAVRVPTPESINVVRTIYDASSKPGPPVQERTELVLQTGTGDELRYDIFQRIALPPGRHQLRLNGTSTALGKSGSVYVDVEIPDFARAPIALTRIVLGATPPEGSRPDPFEGVLPIVPTTARDFTANDKLSAFVRVFQTEPEPITLKVEVLDVRDTRVFEKEIALSVDRFAGGQGVPVEIPLPLSELSRGPHILNVVATRGSTSVRHDLVFRMR